VTIDLSTAEHVDIQKSANESNRTVKQEIELRIRHHMSKFTNGFWVESNNNSNDNKEDFNEK